MSVYLLVGICECYAFYLSLDWIIRSMNYNL